MEKKNWKIKKSLNNVCSKMKDWPRTLRLITAVVCMTRTMFRSGKPPRPDDIGGIMVNDKFKILCVGNPKVGSSSLKLFFQNELPESKFYLDMSYTSFLANNLDKKSYLKISFVRNSWDRVYSCWQDKISNNKRFADMFIITRFKGLYPDMPFEEFVDWLCTEYGADQNADRHWMSQHMILGIDDLSSNLDIIDDIGNMDTQIDNVMLQLNIPNAKLSVSNKYNDGQKVYDFSPIIIKKIAKRYETEIKLFGFKAPNQELAN
jgi:hypothetical protein